MPSVVRVALCLVVAGSLGACAHQPVASFDPNPAPPPGYTVVCQSTPGLFYGLFHDFVTACMPVLLPVEQVVRARG